MNGFVRVDTTGLYPILFHRLTIFSIYLVLYQKNRSLKGFCIHSTNDKLLLICYKISGASKYGYLSFLIVQKVSSLWNNLHTSTHNLDTSTIYFIFCKTNKLQYP